MVEALTDKSYTTSSYGLGICIGIEDEEPRRQIILGNGFGVVGENALNNNELRTAVQYLQVHLNAAPLLRSVKESGAEVVHLAEGTPVIIRNLALSNNFKIA
jgi:hypothetical protein